MLVCPECERQWKNPVALGVHRRRAHGVEGSRNDREAANAMSRQYRHRNQKSLTEAQRIARTLNPVADKARNLFNAAVRRGRIVRPTTCESCGATGRRIEGHHPDHNDPFSVIWLCVPCHRAEDRRMRAAHV